MVSTFSLNICVIAAILSAAISARSPDFASHLSTPSVFIMQPNVTSLFVSSSPDCADSGACTAAASPCCSLKYAVESVASFMVPVTEPVPIMMGTGVYGVASCGVNTVRPLAVQGVGSVTIDCGGSGRVLFSSTSLFMSNLTLTGGYVSDGSDGGAVSIVSSGTSPSFVFVGVVFVNNSVLNGNGGGLSISVSHASQLSGVNVTFESVAFKRNAIACIGAGCGSSDDDGFVVANGGGTSIVMQAPIVTDTSIIINNCQLFSNAAVAPAGLMMVFVRLLVS